MAFNEFDAEQTGEIAASQVAMVGRRLGMRFDGRELQRAMKRASAAGQSRGRATGRWPWWGDDWACASTVVSCSEP